jgi:S-adenosylmethionine hydrolase
METYPVFFRMIVIFTDFGLAGPYTGQMKAVLLDKAATIPIVDLFADAPMFNPAASAQLLAAYSQPFPEGTVFLCVVDPGVGGERQPLVIQADGRYFVGPDNGLFHRLAKQALNVEVWRITYQPERLSASFHGRDLFAPVAAMLAQGKPVPGERVDVASLLGHDWPRSLHQVVYIDHYGNAMTGLTASDLGMNARLLVAGKELSYARTFSEVSRNGLFWYYNSNDLVEIAQNGASAARTLTLEIGTPIRLNH